MNGGTKTYMTHKFLVFNGLLPFIFLIGLSLPAWAYDDQELSEDFITEGMLDDASETEVSGLDISEGGVSDGLSWGEAFDGGAEDSTLEEIAGELETDTEDLAEAEARTEDRREKADLAESVAESATAQFDLLDEVLIGGNDRVEEEAIRIRTSILRGVPLSRETRATVNADIRSIYDMGFFHNVEARLEKERGRTILTYWVSERPLIREVRFEGNKKLDKDTLEVALKIHPRTILNPVRIRRGIEDAKKAYEEKGYLDTDITYRSEQVGPGETAVTFTIEEHKTTGISKVKFEGNESFPAARLRAIMATRAKNFLSRFTSMGTLNREALKTDTERITAFYYDNGYINVKIDEAKIERGDDGMLVTIRIDEGEQFSVGEVHIVGEFPGSEEEALRRVGMEEGTVFKASNLREDVFRLTGYFSNHGFAFVNVEPETQVEPDDSVVNISYQVDQGPEVYIDRIEIAGNTKTRDKVIRRELRISEQSKFEATRLEYSRNRVQRLGLFQDVNLATRRGARSDLLNVLVDVKEGQTGSFSIGAGFNTATSLVGSARMQEMNLMGYGQQLVVSANMGSRYRNSTISWTDPYFLDTHLTLGLEVFDWKFAFEDFDRTGVGAGTRILYPLEHLGLKTLWGLPMRDVSIGVQYQYEKSKISNFEPIAPDAVRAEKGTSFTGKIVPTLQRNTLNHPMDPTKGSYQKLTFSQAGLGGDTTYSKAELQANFFIPVYKHRRWGQLTWMTKSFVGYGVGDIDFTNEPVIGGQAEQVLKDDMPLFDRYFPGGLYSIRGFGERSLGPREPVTVLVNDDDAPNRVRADTFHRPIGGSQQLILNNELMFPIVKPLNLKGAVFSDIGNAFTAEQGMDLGDLRYSVGAGIRWKSPFGPIRIDLAKALNAKNNERTSKIHFSFGGAGGGSSGGGRGAFGGGGY